MANPQPPLTRDEQLIVMSRENDHLTDVNRRLSRATDDALAIASAYGQDDGAHHKAWVIDQIVRALIGTGYSEWIAAYRAGEDGPETYSWDEGIPP